MTKHPLSGVYAAAITPLKTDSSLALDDIQKYLEFLFRRGCHGALILGTTGEGPSFSAEERIKIFRAASEIRRVKPEFRLLAGTGTPSLEETITLTKGAFKLGFDGVVVLPPYYFHQANPEGILNWFQELINRAVPKDGVLLGYHFPVQAGLPIPIEVISKLTMDFPNQFAGFKDSTKESAYALQIGDRLDERLIALVGNEINLSESLHSGGSGCITGMANLHSPSLRRVWEDFHAGNNTQEIQGEINKKKRIIEQYQPYAPTLKVLLSELHGFPSWGVRLPLTPPPTDKIDRLLQEIQLDGGWP
jgi:4-hydroxy-tetrahydrodipicolinate synthase